jgi:mono/diheme cytochrome c family protein
MVLKIAGGAVGLLILFGCLENSDSLRADAREEQKPYTINDAKALFSLKCASCHGMDGTLGASGANDLSKSSLDNEAILAILLKGKNRMPAFREISKEEHQTQLIQVIKSLRK